jgi:hypothetical protein
MILAEFPPHDPTNELSATQQVENVRKAGSSACPRRFAKRDLCCPAVTSLALSEASMYSAS